MSYGEALAEAQRLGYAEADPSDDVGGRDAAAKMAILARMAFGTPVHIDQVRYEGIEQITVHDIAYARELGLELKLIGTAERLPGGRLGPRAPGLPLRRSSRWRRSTARSTRSPSNPRTSPRSRCPARARAGRRRRAPCSGISISAITTGGAQPAVTESFDPASRDRRRCRLGVLPPHGGRRPPGRAGGGRRPARRAGRVDQVGRPERPRRACAAGDGHPPAARVASAGGDRGDRRDSSSCGRGRGRSGSSTRSSSDQDRRDRALPRSPAVRGRVDPVVTLGEGSTPLVLGRSGCRSWSTPRSISSWRA